MVITNSTVAGALAAAKLHIRVAHIETGLRSFNMHMPEELNRILTDRMSSILFYPTQSTVENLKNEGYDNLNIHIVKNGDVMLDGAIFYRDLASKPDIVLADEYNLATIHRAENTDDVERLKSIISAFNEIAKERQIVLPIHPRTKVIFEQYDIETHFTVISPVGYLEMVYLIKNAKLVMTDSGGLQKEAFFFEKPCYYFT